MLLFAHQIISSVYDEQTETLTFHFKYNNSKVFSSISKRIVDAYDKATDKDEFFFNKIWGRFPYRELKPATMHNSCYYAPNAAPFVQK